MAKEMPTCSKCGNQHWHFANCSTGKKYVRVGYDTIKKPTEYYRLQYRARPRVYYRGDDYDDGPPDAA